MAKPDKDKEPRSRKSDAKSTGDAPTSKKPTLFKRIVKTIGSLSKDKPSKAAEEESRRAAAASRKQSLDQAVEDLKADANPEASAQPPSPHESAPPEPAKKKPKSVKKSEKPDSEADSKRSDSSRSKVVLEPPPLSHVYGVPTPEFNASIAKAAKFDIEPPHSASTPPRPVAPIALVDQIFSTRLVLLVRDPEMVYAYWDVTEEDRRFHRLDAMLPPRHLALRLYDHGREAQPSLHPHVYVDFLLQPGVDSRYLKLPLKDRWWRADLGIKDEMVGFTALARSNTVRSPRDQVAEWSSSARPALTSPSSVESLSVSPQPQVSDAPPTSSSETIFQHTFRLSGGTTQTVSTNPAEIVESSAETRSILRVRPEGSSGMTLEQENEIIRTLKVRSIGASDLSSRQS